MNIFDKILRLFGLVRYKRFADLSEYAWETFNAASDLNMEFMQYKNEINAWQTNAVDEPPVRQPPNLKIIQGGKDVH